MDPCCYGLIPENFDDAHGRDTLLNQIFPKVSCSDRRRCDALQVLSVSGSRNEDTYTGKDAGGISGSGNNSANQTTGYAFGQGESADGVSGGGGGLYGGYKGGTS